MSRFGKVTVKSGVFPLADRAAHRIHVALEFEVPYGYLVANNWGEVYEELQDNVITGGVLALVREAAIARVGELHVNLNQRSREPPKPPPPVYTDDPKAPLCVGDLRRAWSSDSRKEGEVWEVTKVGPLMTEVKNVGTGLTRSVETRFVWDWKNVKLEKGPYR